MEIATSLLPHQHLSLTDTLQISSFISPINAVAPPPVKSRHVTARRSVLKRRRRTRRRRSPPSDDEGGIPFVGGDDGFFGGGNWNFGGGSNGSDDDWFSSFNNGDDNNNNNAEDPAFDFVFEVVCWIVFSNCLHFACKKVVRLVSEDREKVPLRIASVSLD